MSARGLEGSSPPAITQQGTCIVRAVTKEGTCRKALLDGNQSFWRDYPHHLGRLGHDVRLLPTGGGSDQGAELLLDELFDLPCENLRNVRLAPGKDGLYVGLRPGVAER